LVAHDPTESFGLVLNHQSALLLSDIFEHIELDLPIFNGGPVAQEQLFYLHRFAEVTDATKVTEHLYFGGDWKEVLVNSWTADDMAMLVMILSFWFVGRVYDRQQKA
jgi:putative transcriptional regulator